MNYNQVGWFEIPVSDTERAQKFYESLLQLELKRQDVPGYEMVWFPNRKEGMGISGALMKGDGYHPVSSPTGGAGTVIYFLCNDLDAALKRAVDLGSTIILPKKDIGEFGFISWITDSEGNTIGLQMMKVAL